MTAEVAIDVASIYRAHLDYVWASLRRLGAPASDLEDIAPRQEGVRKVFAMQAGREIRVMVDPESVDDQATALISHESATAIEREMQYPGQIKITVIRELRATRHAR